MQLVKRIRGCTEGWYTKFCVLAFILVFLLTRLPGLSKDVINPDGVNWHYRSEQFVVALKAKDFARTFQHYHPGVTLMWVVGSAVEVMRQFFPIERVYTHYNFLTFHFIAKYALVLSQLALTLLALYFLSQVWEFKKAFFAVALFTFEPFFVGNSRLLHLDVLVTLLLFLGLVVFYIAWVGVPRLYLVGLRALRSHLLDGHGAALQIWGLSALAGAFFALAFLTKSIAIGSLVFVLGWWILQCVVGTHSCVPLQKSLRRHLPLMVSLLLGFLLILFLFFPALWVKPVSTLTEIFREGERIGIRKGHGQIIFGEYTRNGGIIFYPLVLLMKVSPVVWVGVLASLVTVIKCVGVRGVGAQKFVRLQGFGEYLTIFYLGYFLVMFFPSKKLDRYMLPMFPYLAMVAVWGYGRFVGAIHELPLQLRKVVTSGGMSLFVGVFVILPLIKFYPYYFTYTSPIFGSTTNAHRVIAQKPFGVGIPALKEFLFEKYGLYPDLGFYDVKPMRAIYPNSKICDIRVCGTSDYDILVLGPNEELPEKVLKGDKRFVHDDSMYINGLEYWKVYVKKD